MRTLSVLLSLVVVLTPSVGLAQQVGLAEEFSGDTVHEERPSLWRSDWPTFSWLEGGAMVAAGVGTLALALHEPPAEARWKGGILFDDAARDGMRLESKSARQRARSLGDLPYYAAPLIPLLIDPLLVAWLGHDDSKAAANLALVGLESFSYVGLLSFVSTRVSVRERPDSAECRRDPDGQTCEVDTESFWSGHTSIAAASAGIVCSSHLNMPLWKYRALDVGACALASSGALATGLSRILADRHYATDVVAGAAVGFGVGYFVPVLLHYSSPGSRRSVSLQVSAPCAGCLGVAGAF